MPRTNPSSGNKRHVNEELAEDWKRARRRRFFRGFPYFPLLLQRSDPRKTCKDRCLYSHTVTKATADDQLAKASVSWAFFLEEVSIISDLDFPSPDLGVLHPSRAGLEAMQFFSYTPVAAEFPNIRERLLTWVKPVSIWRSLAGLSAPTRGPSPPAGGHQE